MSRLIQLAVGARLVRLMLSLTIASALSNQAVAIPTKPSIPLSSTALSSSVLFMRHALAPGKGDPDYFNIDDCTSQRNLSQQGRQQAQRIGQQFRQHGIQPTAIYSSYWCRCWQTAELMNLGKVFKHHGLNSFFQAIVDHEQTLTQLRQLMDQLDPDKGPYLFVTHQVVIFAISGISAASGGLVDYDLKSKQVSRFEFSN